MDNDIHRETGKLLSTLGFINKQLKANLDAFSELYDNYPERLSEHNENLARTKAVNVGECINPIEEYYLDEQQLTAIAYDVGSGLVIAGAGTGKTMTTIGLVKYLLRSRKASPEEILALSFTNASVDNLKKRVMAEAEQRMDVDTFHSLGLKIIASACGTVPKISNIKLDEFITSFPTSDTIQVTSSTSWDVQQDSSR